MSGWARVGCGLLLVLQWLGCAAHETGAVAPASSQARAVVGSPDPLQATSGSWDASTPPPAAVSPALAPHEVPAGVQTFAGFRSLTAAELDADFGEYTVHANPDAPPQSVASCRALLKLPISPEMELESSNENEDRSFWFSVMDCAAWSVVQSGRAASHTNLAALLSAKDPTRLLPPLLGLTDFTEVRSQVEAAAADCRSWKAFDPSVRVKQNSADGFQVRATAWRGEVRYIARADFDGDGTEDLLVRRDAEADGGSFRASALFVLSQTDQDRCLRVALAFGQS